MPAEANALLVVNPRAGRGRGLRLLPRVLAALQPRFPGLEVRISAYAGHAEAIGREAAGGRWPLLLTLGGDGTPFEVVNGLFGGGRPAPGIELGMIPAGTGNSFLRDFGIGSWQQATAAILAGRRRRIDLLEIDYLQDGRPARRVLLNILGLGLIADILKLTNEKLKGLGALGYSLAVMLCLARGTRNRLALSVDGEPLAVADSSLVVSNSRYTGGAMKIAPLADAQDGRADLVLFQEADRLDMLAIFARVFRGRHVGHPRVKTWRASEIVVDAAPAQRLMADGELLGMTPLRLRVLPGELTVLA